MTESTSLATSLLLDDPDELLHFDEIMERDTATADGRGFTPVTVSRGHMQLAEDRVRDLALSFLCNLSCPYARGVQEDENGTDVSVATELTTHPLPSFRKPLLSSQTPYFQIPLCLPDPHCSLSTLSMRSF